MTLTTIIPFFLGRLGGPEIILIIVLIVIFFGAKKIPELMRGAGRGVKEFKDAMNKDYSTQEDKPESEDKSDVQKKE